MNEMLLSHAGFTCILDLSVLLFCGDSFNLYLVALTYFPGSFLPAGDKLLLQN